MRQKHHFAGKFITAVAACLLLSGNIAQADETAGSKPLQFRGIMQGLDRNMQDITAAISREDWELVAQLAPKIAKHPEPPLTEKMRILAYLGTNASEFHRIDAQTHEAARDMEQFAEFGDGKAVIQAFARVQENCLACHQNFRKPFVEHFYGSH
jgi:cytochrome c556